MRTNRTFKRLSAALLIILLMAFSACKQGAVSEKPPVHLNPNMDNQEKYKAQEESEFFVNGAVNRMPVKGTVAVNEYHPDKAFYYGKNKKGGFVFKAPVAFSKTLLQRGHERFNIYCAPCHSRAGDGKGIVAQRGFLPPPSFHQDKYRKYPDGQIFNVISDGFRNMPSYKHQIPVPDRWAIVGYVRVLQRSQSASIDDIPEKMRNQIK